VIKLEAGTPETAFLGLAIVDALLDLLIDNGTIDSTDAWRMLASLSDRLGKETNSVSQRCSKIIADGIPR
jgi:hypothetical protein